MKTVGIIQSGYIPWRGYFDFIDEVDTFVFLEDVRVDYSRRWVDRHLETIRHSYGKTEFFQPLFDDLSAILREDTESLTVLNRTLVDRICEITGISTPRLVSTDLDVPGAREDKLLGIVKAVGGDEYLSGPSAMAYLDPARWDQEGIGLRFKDYSGYPEYRQISEPFEPNVSIIDAIFMQGPDLQSIMGRKP